MIIKPTSELAAEPFIAGDFPALKHFWHCKQASGPSILDIVGDANIAATTTKSGNGLVIPNLTTLSSVFLTGGGLATLTPFGFKNCILIGCADWVPASSNTVIYGNSSDGVSLGNTLFGARAFYAATNDTCPTIQQGGSFTRCTVLRGNGSAVTGIQSFEVNGAILDTDLLTNTGSIVNTAALQTPQPGIFLTTGPFTLYGYAMLKFAGDLPPMETIQAACAWLDYQWRNNANITMYPGFKGLV